MPLLTDVKFSFAVIAGIESDAEFQRYVDWSRHDRRVQRC